LASLLSNLPKKTLQGHKKERFPVKKFLMIPKLIISHCRQAKSYHLGSRPRHNESNLEICAKGNLTSSKFNCEWGFTAPPSKPSSLVGMGHRQMMSWMLSMVAPAAVLKMRPVRQRQAETGSNKTNRRTVIDKYGRSSFRQLSTHLTNSSSSRR